MVLKQLYESEVRGYWKRNSYARLFAGVEADVISPNSLSLSSMGLDGAFIAAQLKVLIELAECANLPILEYLLDMVLLEAEQGR